MTIEQGRELLTQAKERLRSRHALGFFDAAFQRLNRDPSDGTIWYERLLELNLRAPKARATQLGVRSITKGEWQTWICPNLLRNNIAGL